MHIRVPLPDALLMIESAVEATADGRVLPVFRPDAMTRLAVRATVVEWMKIRVDLTLSTNFQFLVTDDGALEVVRVAVFRSAGRIDVILTHELSLLGSPSGCAAVALVASRIVPGNGGFTTASFRSPAYRQRLTHMCSQDFGATWKATDVTDLISDCLVDEHGEATVKHDGWATKMPGAELLGRLDRHELAVDGKNGFPVDPWGVLTRYAPNDYGLPTTDVYSAARKTLWRHPDDLHDLPEALQMEFMPIYTGPSQTELRLVRLETKSGEYSVRPL